MDMTKPMSLLLIEDDVSECNLFKNFVTNRDDVRFIGVTNSSIDGINLVKSCMPEGIIVDLELHKGHGSGLEFLTKLQIIPLDFKPIIIVTTNISSNIIYNHAHDTGADLIFYKKQSDYCPEMVINSLLMLRKSLYIRTTNSSLEVCNVETPDDLRVRTYDKINYELDLVGIASHLVGRKYLFDAIYFLLQSDSDNESVFHHLTNVHKRVNSSVSRAMQVSINNAWRKSAIEDLQLHYTARISYQTGVPTPTEFIYFYAGKIRKFI